MKGGYDMGLPESRAVGESSRSQTQDKPEAKRKLTFVGQGAVGAFIATGVCCLLPAVAIAIGLTGGLATTIVSLGRFRLYGIIFGLGFMAFASWLSIRHSRSHCAKEEYKHRQLTILLIMFASFGAIYVLIMYLVVPLLYRIS